MSARRQGKTYREEKLRHDRIGQAAIGVVMFQHRRHRRKVPAVVHEKHRRHRVAAELIQRKQTACQESGTGWGRGHGFFKEEAGRRSQGQRPLIQNPEK